MPDAGYYLLTGGSSVLAFLLGLWIGIARRRAALAAYLVLLALLLFKAVLNHRPAWEYGLFPSPTYIYFQSYLLYPLALSCMGLAVGLLPRGRNRTAVAALAAFCFAVSLWTERWMLIQPDVSSQQGADAEHHCPQSTDYSCGPAACVSLLSYLGVQATEGQMMHLCRTPPYGGTSLFRICRGLRLRLDSDPYRVRIVDADADELRGMGVPAIVSDGKLHVIVAHFDGDTVVVHDPIEERPVRIPFEQYRRRYDGPAVVVTPSANGPRAAETGSRSLPR